MADFDGTVVWITGGSRGRARERGRAGRPRPRKLTALIGYGETVRGLTHLAAERARVNHASGLAYPDPLTTNLAKWTFAREYTPRSRRSSTSRVGCS